MIYKVLSGIFFVLIVAGLIFGNNYKKQNDLYLKTIENDFIVKYRVLELKHRQSELTRVRLGHNIDSLNLLSKTLSESKLKVDQELKNLKGKYANRTPSELEQLMIDKAR